MPDEVVQVVVQLQECFYAAGAIRRTVETIETLLDEADEVAREYFDGSGRDPSDVAAALLQIDSAFYEVQHLVWWVRALFDRLEHTWQGQHLGLIAVVPAPERAQLATIGNELDSEIGELREAANQSLHNSAIPKTMAIAGYAPGAGHLHLPFPDLPIAKGSAQQTYLQGRDVRGESARAVTATDRAMSQIVDWFTSWTRSI